jgi:hypothetical protein
LQTLGAPAIDGGSSRSPKAVIDFVPKAAIDSMDGSDLAFSVSGL